MQTLLGWLHYNSKTSKFFGVPKLDDLGAKNIKICATDSHAKSVCTTLTVLVESLGCPAIGKTLELAHAKTNRSFSLTVPEETFKSPRGASLKLQASSMDGSNLPKWLNFDPDQSQFSGMPGPGDHGAVVVKLAALEPACNSLQSVFTVLVSGREKKEEKSPFAWMMSWWFLLLWITIALCLLWCCGVRLSCDWERVIKSEDGETQVIKDTGDGQTFTNMADDTTLLITPLTNAP